MAGPSSERTVLAVTSCTQALAAVERGQVDRTLQRARTPLSDIDATMATASAGTLSGLRAIGDRAAIRARHHDAAVHHTLKPGDALGAILFDALERARLDSLGVHWLVGVRQNLLAHPGSDNDGVRWLAFEILSGVPAPREKTDLVNAVRAALSPSLATELTALRSSLHDQERFAEAATSWARAALARLPKALITTPERASFPLPVRDVVRQLPRRGNPGAASAPLRKEDRQRGDDEEGTASGHAAMARSGVSGYRAYTTTHDRVVNAAALVSREELAALRARLDAEFGSIRAIVARLAKRLMRVLMARQLRQWRFDLDDGVLDGSRLAALVASGGKARPFKQETDSPFPGTVVSLLIDHSGSMRGRPMLIAALTVEVFARVLERCGVKCEVLGFTTRDWNGGEPARQWAADGYPENPGRLNALEHIIIKSADVPWRRARVGLGLFLHDEMLKENIDGEALQWAHGRMRRRHEPRRILVVVSDGTPMDEATLAANGYEYLEAHLQSVVNDIESHSRVQLAAIGIGHNVSLIYRNATTIGSIEQLGPALSSKLMALLGAND